jgi:LuxR family maltose regulon positive regulatory protein
MQGDLTSAVRWLRTADLAPDAGIMLWWIETPRITECRVLIAEGSDAGLQEAIAKLQGYETENEAVNNTFQTIVMQPLLALAFKKQGRVDDALSVLEQALELAEPGRWIQPFVEIGPPIADLLDQLRSRGVAPDYIDQILAAFGTNDERRTTEALDASSGQRPASAPGTAPGLVEPLTEREMEVLALLAQRLTNKEIAKELVVAPGTIKAHTHTIYGKLGVQDRRQAVARARELGLLDPD